MRNLPQAGVLLIALSLSGCMAAGVYGEGPVKDCGRAHEPATAHLRGVEASWLGVEFQANTDDVEVWIEGSKSDLQFWGQRPVEGWSLLVIDPDAPPGEMVRNARGGLGRYHELGSSVKVGGSAGPGAFNEPAKDAGATLELLEHVRVDRGDRVFVYAAATQSVPDINLQVRWTGCGQTSDVVGGPRAGYAAGWDDFTATLLVSNVRTGAVAYDAMFSAPTDEGILLAMQPPAGSQHVHGKASLTTSEGTNELGATPRFYVHQGGPVQYATTFAGGGDSARGPLLAYFPVPLRVLEGPYQREPDSWERGNP